MMLPIAISLPAIGKAEIAAVTEVMRSGWLTQGARTRAFEGAFAERHGARCGVATTSCTTALHLALVAMGIRPGDEVIVPAFTWVATANVVRHCGARPVFADVHPDTFNIDPASVADRLSDRTRAVIPVHLFGLCADIPALRLRLPPGVKILEDAACAAGAAWNGVSAGSQGDAACFSFHPRKVMTCGEGGIVTTNDNSLAERMSRLRNHGAAISEEERHHGPAPYRLPAFEEAGFNFRMTDLQAAILGVQLTRLDAMIAERQGLADIYDRLLADLPWLTPPQRPASADLGWQAYVVVVDETQASMSRNAIMAALATQGIATRPGTHSLTTLGVYEDLARSYPCPVADRLQETTLALPLHNHMTEDDVVRVVDALKNL